MWTKLTALLLAGLCLVGQTTALRCHSCEGLCNCLQPSTVDCPYNTQCFTVKRLADGKITRKGCTQDCNLVNDFDGMCTLCRGPSCNTETSLTPMSGSYDECQGGMGQGVNQPGGMGQGVNQPGIGGGLGQPSALGQQGGLGQGLGNQGLGQGLGNQGLGNQGLGNQGLGQPSGGFGQGHQHGGMGNQGLNYQPAPSIGANNPLGQQRYGDDGTLGQGFGNNAGGMGQGFNNGMGQGLNGGGFGQGFGNAAARVNFNLLALGAAMFGLNRL